MAEMLSATRRLIRQAVTNQNEALLIQHKKRIDLLMNEREEMYFGNKDVLKKIVVEYAATVRKNLAEKSFQDRIGDIPISE